MTFGCRVNQADSLRLEEDLRARGGIERASTVTPTWSSSTPARSPRPPIRARARRSAASPARTRRRAIVATGCYATRCADEVAALPGCRPRRAQRREVRLVVAGTRGPARAGGHVARRDRDGDGPCGAPIEPGVAGRTAFTLRVQTGCEERCTYCIIPTTRGASRSLPVRRRGPRGRARCGVRLQGNRAHRRAPRLVRPRSVPGVVPVELLRALDRIAGDVTFRISSLEPMDCTPAIVDLVARSGRFAPHFHLPLQHASDRMLRRDGQTVYARRLPAVARPHRRTGLPHASIGSDMIVGFPGETDEDFAANLDYLPSSPLTHLHVFPYSDRPGTAASGMRGRCNGTIVARSRRRACARSAQS